jgi:Na+-driven multidrug efflux pump
MLMFALFPILGITRVYSIAGYNHGAQNYEGSRKSIQISIKYAALLASLILFYTLLQRLLYPFYHRSKVIAETPDALRWYLQLLLLLPSINRAAAYFQAAEMLKSVV